MIENILGIDEKKIQSIPLDFFGNGQFFILRQELLDPEISGNKWWKLKYFLTEAYAKKQILLSFGGAFSNHLAALAAACFRLRIPSVGIIRGLHADLSNPTLQKAAAQGMKLLPVERNFYDQKSDLYTWAHQEFPDYYLIPEGGFGEKGRKGVKEMIELQNKKTDFYVCPIGTGTTFLGILDALEPHQKIIGVPVFAKSKQATHEKELFANIPKDKQKQAVYLKGFEMGGFAKKTPHLVQFASQFEKETEIKLDLIYTGKTFLAVQELIHQNFFKEKKEITIIHTGGLQGNSQ